VDRQIRHLGIALVVLFALLFLQINYLQVFHASALFNNPHNVRVIIQEYRDRRGEILAGDGRTVLARSIPTNGSLKFLRRYPQGPLYGHVTGFYSLVFGRTRLESTYNDFLSARATELLPSTIEDEILNRPKRGGTVITTIDPQLQRVAFQALSQASPSGGGLAAIDPQTGAVLALVSIPSYDPNPLSSHDPQEIRRAMDALRPNSARTRLLSNATDQLFPPGSTFKLIDTAAALAHGATPQTEFDNPLSLKLPQTTHRLHNFGGEHCAGGAPKISLSEALIVSCDVTFAEIGLQLGAQVLHDQAEAFGFNQHIPFDFPVQPGQFPPADSFADRLPGLAFSAIGQQDVKANPLQMAMVAAAIANGGVEMRPRLVKEILDPQGAIVKSFGAEVLGHPVTPEIAAEITQMMVGVVQRGTRTGAQIPGVQVGGKTGTAETASGKPHAWFVSFAPATNPRIAVAVVVLNGGSLGSEATGGQVAAPVARAVIQAALQGGTGTGTAAGG
jgi:penicillin-binding protein A